MKVLTMGSLFDGISGFPLAASWAGIETKWISEIDPYCLKVSKKNFPNAKQYGNIKELYNPEPVDIICGGFPCQPFSVAGNQQGKEDDRYLWPEMFRVVREVKPRWVIGENVPGIINMALDEVLASLENEGYKTETFIIPACAVNAPHRRDRVWIIANSCGGHENRGSGKNESKGKREGVQERDKVQQPCITDNVSNPDSFGQPRQGWAQESISTKKNGNWKASWAFNDGRWPIESPVCGRNDGIPDGVDRLKGLGNAIVPQVAYEIFKAIVEIENQLSYWYRNVRQGS